MLFLNQNLNSTSSHIIDGSDSMIKLKAPKKIVKTIKPHRETNCERWEEGDRISRENMMGNNYFGFLLHGAAGNN